ncbi:CTNA3 protein, partial [Polypterus senegalus]
MSGQINRRLQAGNEGAEQVHDPALPMERYGNISCKMSTCQEKEKVEEFQKLQKAKDVLLNEDSRSRYDYWRRCQIAIPFQEWEALSDSVKTNRGLSTLLFPGAYDAGKMSTLQTTELLIDPKDLQIRTVTVEKLLEPLITQVTTLINCPRNPSNKKKGCSKRAQVLLRSVEDATLHLVEKGEKIAKDSNLLKDELMAAVEEVWKEILLSPPLLLSKLHPPPPDSGSRSSVSWPLMYGTRKCSRCLMM